MWRNNFPSKAEQFDRAQLISPYFSYLRGRDFFKKDVENIRIKFWIKKTSSTLYTEASLFVLHQEFWEKDFDWMSIVNNSWKESKEIWKMFHKDIEKLCRKYKLRNFPNLVKEYILTGKFGDLFAITLINKTDYNFQITIPRNIKKKDFTDIWNMMQIQNEKFPVRKRYSKLMIERSESVKKIDTKFMDQDDILLLIDNKLDEYADNGVEKKLFFGDKGRKSKLKAIVRDLFALLNQLNRY